MGGGAGKVIGGKAIRVKVVGVEWISVVFEVGKVIGRKIDQSQLMAEK